MKEIKVGNGGAGIVGFVQFMHTKFNEVKGTNYDFTWITSDTEETLNGLESGALDMGWPYGISRVCDKYQENKEIWKEPIYLFRDHFILVGPKSNCAKLPVEGGDHPHVSKKEVYEMFDTISKGENGTFFLTRDDLSGTNVMEREIFKEVLGRYPNVKTDKWYIPLKGEQHYPDAALEESNKKGYYTLNDRGIWTYAAADKKADLMIFCEGGDTNPDDILLNPCLAIAQNTSEEAIDFYEWLKTDGQEYIPTYKLNGDRLYSKAPKENKLPCSKSK
jgi:ABC-type tungstate transport system permease subunit